MVRHNNQLPDNLPQLQNLIKRDPESYKEEVSFSHKHFNNILIKLQKNLPMNATVFAAISSLQIYFGSFWLDPRQIQQKSR